MIHLIVAKPKAMAIRWEVNLLSAIKYCLFILSLSIFLIQKIIKKIAALLNIKQNVTPLDFNL
ncbi:hypothetical protein C4M96_00360 [Mycoplasmopsis pullorum]|nr:hypothetical protein C4M96_00360 [Mycoplasmopsis pullorum]